MMARIGLTAPWIVYYREVEALFREDKGVQVIFDDEKNELKLYVDDSDKAAALALLLPTEKTFGNVKLKIAVVPGNKSVGSAGALIPMALKDNPAVSYIKKVTGFVANDMTFVVFKKTVVQYYTDDISDIHGIHSTLYQDLAERIFEDHEGVFFCTDVTDANMLGEWP